MAIRLFIPTYDVESCLKEIRECLEVGWTGMGFKTIEFEKKWKEYTGMKNAHFLNSATSGLNLTFDILKEVNDWKDDDEVITTPLTFISSNHAILLAELKPVFADVDDTLCLSPTDVENKITSKTKAILYVGMGGSTGRYEEIVELAKKYKLKLILDAAHMSGTRLNGEIPGKEADVVVYSFQAVKNLPTADSGMVCFKNDDLDSIARKKTWLGIDKDTFSRTDSQGNYKWRYDVEYVGQKYHGNSIMAAIGITQLKALDKDNSYRRKISEWYNEGFSDLGEYIRIINNPEGCESAKHLHQIIVQDRDYLLKELNKKDIYPGVHYVDNTEYRMYKFGHGTCQYAHYVSNHIISLPLHMRLTQEDVKLVIKEVRRIVQETGKLHE